MMFWKCTMNDSKKKQKLKLQIHLLEQQVNASKTFATALNANFVVLLFFVRFWHWYILNGE